MAEPRFERDLRTMLARDLDAIHGPHGRWADSPVARRIERSSGLAGRWPVLAVLAAAALVVLGVVAVLGSRPGPVPAPTPTPTPTATASAAAVRCPTLADYLAVSAAPTATPSPSFAAVAPGTRPSTGILAPGQVGVMAAPDGSPGALFRVSNPRFCDRLPDHRLETYILSALPGDFRLLLVDVEITVLISGTIPTPGFIPGNTVVFAESRGSVANAFPVPYDFPSSNSRTTMDLSAGFSYRGVMSWIVEGGDRAGRVTVDIGAPDAIAFSYLISDGPAGQLPMRPLVTAGPASSPGSGSRALDTWTTVSDGTVRMPVFVGGVAVVDGYPRVMPDVAGDRFLEVFLHFGIPSAPYTIDPSDWVVVGPDGRDLPRPRDPGTSTAPLLPDFALQWDRTVLVTPAEQVTYPLFAVAEVPPTGRITLEYRPHGGPAQVSWVVRDH